MKKQINPSYKAKVFLPLSMFLVLLISLTSCSPKLAPDTATVPIGTITASMLSYDKFTNNTGDPAIVSASKSKWAPCDGRQIVGSRYNMLTNKSNTPDLRGVFLRCVNQIDPSEQRVDTTHANPQAATAGDYQADEFKSHTHYENSPQSGGNGSYTFADNTGFTTGNHNAQRGWDAFTSASGGAETRPKNVSVYYYIRIN